MSAESLFSAHWHRVAETRPHLAGDVEVRRHVYRGRVSWVLQRRSTSTVHRLDTAGFELVDRLDGHRTVEEVWEQALLERDRDAPTQDEWIGLLAELHAAELLVVDQRVPAERLFERREERRSRERRERHLNPLCLRFGLYDPDALLTRLLPLARASFSRPALLVWLALLAAGILALLPDTGRLAATLSDPAFPAAATALLFVLLYPPLKLVHELAHGLAVKRCGGEVHECGITLMVLMPLPYVDASASAAFPEKGQRLLVGAAGILVELAFAAFGALLWANASGLAAEIGLVLLLVGGLSTLLVNGNPLLRFDGYYLLADWLEIPNLATRSRRAVLGWLRALLSGERPRRPEAPDDARERAWLLGYGVLAGLYRTGLMLWIAWWLSDRYLLLGLALAGFALHVSLLLPLLRGLRAVARDRALHAPRPLAVLLGVPVALAASVLWLPLPQASVTRGVVWLPDEALVRASGACEVMAAPVEPGERVSPGELLFDCADPELGMRERELLARADELAAHAAVRLAGEAASRAPLLAEQRANEAALADVRERIASGRRVAALEGVFGVLGSGELVGRAMSRGDIVGYVVPDRERTVRVALDDAAIERIDTALERVELRVAGARDTAGVHASSILARTPRPSRELPSALLGTDGGGEHPVEPGSEGRRATAPLFDLELAWPAAAAAAPVGVHVDVRFVHEPAPLAPRLARALRRLFEEHRRA